MLSQRLRSTSKELGEARHQLGLDELLEPLDAPYSSSNLGARLSEIAAVISTEKGGEAIDLEPDDDYDDLDADTLDVDSAGGLQNAATEIMLEGPADSQADEDE